MGTVLYKSSRYDSLSKKFVPIEIFPGTKVWFKDSFAIEEIKGVNTESYNGKQTSLTVYVRHYKFVDLKGGWLYEFSSFSDTAKFIKKAKLSDTGSMEGVPFWKDDIRLTKTGQLSDTLMEGISYKRVSLIQYLDTMKVYRTGYCRSEKKGSLFLLAKEFSNASGCPLVRLDALPSIYGVNAVSTEVNFISNELSKDEMKIFDAWKSRIKK